jgi:hypothetical protein
VLENLFFLLVVMAAPGTTKTKRDGERKTIEIASF